MLSSAQVPSESLIMTLVPKDNFALPISADFKVPQFEINVEDLKAVWMRYFNDPEWTKTEDEFKEELKPSPKTKVNIVKEKLKTIVNVMKRNSRWAITPYSPEISFCKNLQDKLSSSDKLSFDLQLDLIELIYKTNPPVNTPAHRAIKILKDKITGDGKWDNVAALIIQLKNDNLITPQILSAVIHQARYILPERFTQITNTIRELQIEEKASAEDVAALIPLSKSHIVATFIRELRAAGCANRRIFYTILHQAERAEELANSFYGLRHDKKRKLELMRVTLEIYYSNITDFACIFDILKKPQHYKDIADVICALREVNADTLENIQAFLKLPQKGFLLVELIDEIKPFYKSTDTTRFVNLILQGFEYLWGFIEAIGILHQARIDRPENITAILLSGEYALEIGDTLEALYDLQLESKPITHFCTQENFDFLLKYPQHAFKIATLIPSLFYADLATADNINLIISQLPQFAWDIAKVVDELCYAKINIQSNFDKICKHAVFSEKIAMTLKKLRYEGYTINQKIFDENLQEILKEDKIYQTIFPHHFFFSAPSKKGITNAFHSSPPELKKPSLAL